MAQMPEIPTHGDGPAARPPVPADSPAPTGDPDLYPVDVVTIRATTDEIIRAQPDRDHPADGLLVGHIQLLVPELTRLMPRMLASYRDTARHVLAGTARFIEAYEQGDGVAYALAIQCRALVILYERPGPLLPYDDAEAA